MTAHSDVVIDAVIPRIAEELGADPLELEPLAAVVDPDLVGAFLTSDAVLPDSELRFRYEGREVLITGDGSVRVEPPE